MNREYTPQRHRGPSAACGRSQTGTRAETRRRRGECSCPLVLSPRLCASARDTIFQELAGWVRGGQLYEQSQSGAGCCAKQSQSQGSFKFEVSSFKWEEPGVVPADFKLHTSNFTLPEKRLAASLRTGRLCGTKPIPGCGSAKPPGQAVQTNPIGPRGVLRGTKPIR